MLPLRKNIREMAGYVPGFQPPDTSWLKLNANENPYPPSPKVAEAIKKELEGGGINLRQYPDAGSKRARQIAADLYGFDPSWVVMANGSDELLNNLIRAFVDDGEEIAYINPSYSYYAPLANIQGAALKTFGLTADGRIEGLPERYEGKIFFLTSPNAPLGVCFDNHYIEELAQRCAGILVVDEAYVDFADHSAIDLVHKYENLVVTRTMSKSYALAGMRLGLAIAHPEVVQALDKIRDHYHLDRLALVAAEAALLDQDYLRATVAKVCQTREWFSTELRKIGFSVDPSGGNYIFAVPPAQSSAKGIYDGLFERKILVRYFSDPLLERGLRITIGTQDEMEQTLKAIVELI